MKRIIASILCTALAVSVTSCACDSIPETSQDRAVVRIAVPKNISDMELLVNTFEEKNPNVRIEKVDMPRSSAERHSVYVSAMSSGDSSIDMYWLDDSWTEEFAGYGYLEPLDGRIKPDESLYITNSCKVFSYGGNLYALPLAIDTDFIFYRKDIVNTPPADWAEIKKLVGSGNRINSLCVNDKISIDMIYDILDFKESMNCGYDEVLEFYKNTIDTNRQDNDVEYISPFKTGGAVFLKDGCSEWYELNDDISAVRGNVRAVMLPEGNGKRFIREYGLGINALSENKEYSMKFLEFLSVAENQRLLAREYGLMPVISGFYDDEMILDVNPHFYGVKEIIKEAQHYSELRIDGETDVILENALLDYFSGKTDVQTVCGAFEAVFGK